MTTLTNLTNPTNVTKESAVGDGTTADGAVQDGGPAGRTATSAGRGARLVAVGAVLLAAAAALLLGVQAHRAAAEADARTDALAAARERVPELLGYDSATLDEDLADALAQTTGKFTSDYGAILDDVVKPQAKARRISTVARVSAAGVVRGDADRVVVLLFLTQTTTSGGDGETVAGSRVEVTMERAGDDWKIAGLRPV
ncbi:Mce-associated membrane protein [Nocardioides aromaticivorans]|uniref:Mce-associated membrane protein n=1 Tax=Nocardioides aromaticivorans TaxID=200618 RepID=A0A7Y9ZGU7_9ACTN|nr:hypothetical protein [Nocardioides aromaticivorans]NYI45204.1 Mce-associated membrane protein [Nocardioides aromaticivorans]